MNLGTLCNCSWYWIMFSETGCMVSSPDGWHLDFGRAIRWPSAEWLCRAFSVLNLQQLRQSFGAVTRELAEEKFEPYLKWHLLPTKQWSTEHPYLTRRSRWPSYSFSLPSEDTEKGGKSTPASHMCLWIQCNSLSTLQGHWRSNTYPSVLIFCDEQSLNCVSHQTTVGSKPRR